MMDNYLFLKKKNTIDDQSINYFWEKSKKSIHWAESIENISEYFFYFIIVFSMILTEKRRKLTFSYVFFYLLLVFNINENAFRWKVIMKSWRWA